jgi:hypothetical protein
VALSFMAALVLTGCGPFDSNSNSQPVIGEPEKGTTFEDVSAILVGPMYARGNGEGYGGIAWLDYDGDADLDLFLNNEVGFSSALFQNNGDGTFTNVTESANAVVMSGNSGVVVGDIDNDGCPDIFMSGTGFFAGSTQSQTVLLHNQCDGTFVYISATANVPGAETALSAAMADIDNDGDLDLFVTAEGHLGFGSPPRVQHADKLYRNNGDLTFTDISESAGVAGALGSCVASFSHFDDDEFIDLFVGVCNDVTLAPTPWHVYRNIDGTRFEDVAHTTQLDKGGFWMSSAFGDIDNDGDFDIFATNLGGTQTHHLWRNNGDGTYVNIAPDSGEGDFWAWGATFADWDNDGFQDLYYVGELPGSFGIGKGNTGHMFFNNGDSRFTVNDEAHGLELLGKGVTGLAKADYDADGFVDFVIMTSYNRNNTVAAPILMRNMGNGNKSLSIRLEGTTSNRMAIGGRIEVIDNAGVFQAREIWAGSSFVSSESPWPVFGLGQATRADALVYWPCGLVEQFSNLAAGELHHLVEGTGLFESDGRFCDPG